MLEPGGFNYTETRNPFIQENEMEGGSFFGQYVKNVERLKRFRLPLLYIIHFKSQVHQNRSIQIRRFLPFPPGGSCSQCLTPAHLA